MPDIANSNTLLGLFGPMAILAGLGLNIMLVWSRRHSLMGALLGRGFATQISFSAPTGDMQATGAKVVPFGRTQPFSRAVLVREPVIRLAA